MLDNVKIHHYISKMQATYLRIWKSKLTNTEHLVLLDFSENYTFLVQDAPQPYHWVNEQATLQPFVVYCCPDSEVVVKSFVIISECTEHDAVAVSAFQTEVMTLLKQQLPHLRKILYFSDGAPAQYKNIRTL